MQSTKGHTPRVLALRKLNFFKANAASTETEILNRSLRSPYGIRLKKGLKSIEGLRYRYATPKKASPKRLLLPSIGSESLNTTITSSFSSSHKLGQSLPTNSLICKTLSPKSKLPPVELRTNRSPAGVPKPSTSFEALKLPTSPRLALDLFEDQLSRHEKVEINSYSQVYYLGLKANKIKPDAALPNSGYDDEEGFYNFVQGDQLAYRFEAVKVLGKGAFGQVVLCCDHMRNTLVALKIIRNEKRFHRQAAIELQILKQLRDNDLEDSANIVHFKESLLFRRHLVRAS